LNRIRTWTAILICSALTIGLAGTVAARTCWAYYDCTPGISTVVVLTNASEFTLENAVTVRLYDAGGALILESVHGLTAYESTAVFLNGLLDGTDETTWGLAEIDSRLLLQVGVWIGTEDAWLFVENYGELVGNLSEPSIEAYWYGLNYANTNSRRTTVAVLNPNERITLGDLYMYDASGVLQYTRKLQIAPRQPTYIDLENVFPVGDDVWGLVDVSASRPVLLVCSYFDAEGYLIDVDVIDQPYYVKLAEEE
jgi:hypothetical protein